MPLCRPVQLLKQNSGYAISILLPLLPFSSYPFPAFSLFSFIFLPATGVGIGGLGARAPLGAYSLTKIVPNMHQNTPFSHQKSKNFLGRGHSPIPRPFPCGEGTPSPCPTTQVSPLQLDLGYATASSSSPTSAINAIMQYVK